MKETDIKGRLITLRNALTGEEVEIVSTVTQADLKSKQDVADASLVTDAKEIVPAINELNDKINTVKTGIGTDSLSTNAQTIISAINEVDNRINEIDNRVNEVDAKLDEVPYTYNKDLNSVSVGY
jgi:seryl-tRNA synthetase